MNKALMAPRKNKRSEASKAIAQAIDQYKKPDGLQIYSMALSTVALIAWIFVYVIPHSSTPLLRLYPLDKCSRCCLPSLRSGLNWS